MPGRDLNAWNGRDKRWAGGSMADTIKGPVGERFTSWSRRCDAYAITCAISSAEGTLLFRWLLFRNFEVKSRMVDCLGFALRLDLV
jgi:hypothetical protein